MGERVGWAEGTDGVSIAVGVKGSNVIVGFAEFTPQQAEVFAQLFTRACWMAGKNDGEASDD